MTAAVVPIMIRFALVAAVLVMPLVNCASSSAPAETEADQYSRNNFGWMMIGAVGVASSATLLDYGCYCGLGNEVDVQPIDATDSCCMTHDYAWMGAKDVAEGCNCNTAAYVANGTTCAPNQGACAAYCCAADSAFAQCAAANPPADPTHAKYDRTTCEPLECKVDGDCDGGTWCNDGKCVPFCGGGDRGYRAAAVDGSCDVPTTPIATPVAIDRATATAD